MVVPILFAVCTLLTFVLTALLSRFIIPILRSHKMGQRILEIGPRWHKNKEGTPTMGGISFIAASFIMTLGITAVISCMYIDGFEELKMLVFTVFYALLNACIGISDDIDKLLKKRNEGLSARMKFLLQLIAAALYLYLIASSRLVTTSLYIPFIGIELELGIFYYIFALILLTGVVNAVNLTDGIDGLAAMITLVIGVFYALAAFLKYGTPNLPMSVLSAIIIGSTAGFLVYNYYPARVFMGDTGSLFLGAAVVGGAFMLDNPLIIVVAGFVYIAETLSVMLQVSYFKLTHGKRLFKMSPIHHHFELCGWNELKIVYVFSGVTALMCVIAWFGLR